MGPRAVVVFGRRGREGLPGPGNTEEGTHVSLQGTQVTQPVHNRHVWQGTKRVKKWSVFSDPYRIIKGAFVKV